MEGPAAVRSALGELRAGRPLLLRDGEGATTTGFLVVAAEATGAAEVNLLAREGRGLICLALSADRCDELGLALLPRRGRAAISKEFTVSIEARVGVTTGISAADRARTIAVACDPVADHEDLRTPGHVFPLRARPGGLRERAGEAEAAVELARLAGFHPAATICEVLDEDGRLAQGAELAAFERRHQLASVSFAALLSVSGQRAARSGRHPAAA